MFRGMIDYIKDTELKINVYKDKVNIVNYDEVLDFSDNKITIKVGNTHILVLGSNLVINKLFDREILILGEISSVELR